MHKIEQREREKERERDREAGIDLQCVCGSCGRREGVAGAAGAAGTRSEPRPLCCSDWQADGTGGGTTWAGGGVKVSPSQKERPGGWGSDYRAPS